MRITKVSSKAEHRCEFLATVKTACLMGGTVVEANKQVSPAAKRKPPAAGMGRVKGTPNKATGMAREAIAKLVEGNIDQLQDWLDQIARDEKQGPAVAFKMLMDVMEYHIPKLSRAEHTGEGGGPIDHNLNVTFVGKS
ncbi:hypothetical protein RD110_10945 [Rhodoferax koreense]|uniref:Uncharacterized protein n=1 Tax=Rhodoferax koreensis TaxID=1842727 RepID=A0A1P8JV71_9BURK|nr:hypothetical protein [Rhodoferax koreense]APW37644.1 hypothetical protein RD110_10945 [Rhodoferax koreense]